MCNMSEEGYSELALSKGAHYELKIKKWVHGEDCFDTAKALCEYEGWA